MSKLYNTVVELVEEEQLTIAEIGGLLVELVELQKRQLEELKNALTLPFNR